VHHDVRCVLARAGGGDEADGDRGVYLGGWATSAKGGTREDLRPDLASDPLCQIPDEAETLMRTLLTADRNRH
jgi:isocitrate lyase